MPIKFQVYPDKKYFISQWEGKISDQDMIKSYTAFYHGPDWNEQLNELVLICNLDIKNVTSNGLSELADLVAKHFASHNIASSKTAVYSKDDLPFGMARIYEVFSSSSAEQLKVFRKLDEATLWLMQDENNLITI